MNKANIQFRFQDLVVLIAVLVVAGVTWFVARPLSQSLTEKITTLAAKKQQQQQLEDRLIALDQLNKKLPQYQSDIDRLGVAYPKEEQVVEALIQAQAMVERTGVTASSLAPSKGKDGQVPVSLTVKGSYSGIIALLRELHNNLRPVTVTTLALSAGGDKQGGSLTAVISSQFAYGGAAADDSAASVAPADGAVPAAE